MRKLMMIFIACIAIAGCNDPLTDFVNQRFPPISEHEQRIAATNSVAQALAHIHTASLGMGVAFDGLNAIALPPDLRTQGITRVKLSGDRQLLRVDINFDRTFEVNDRGANVGAVKLPETLRPRVQGAITIFAGLASEIVDQPDVPVLQLKLLPAISTIKVSKIDIAGRVDVTQAGVAIVDILNKYKDNISGELSRSKLTSMTLPLLSKAPIDPSRTIKVDSAALHGAVLVKAQPLTAPFQLDGIAWLIAEKQITVLAQLIPTSAAPHAQGPSVSHTFDTIGKAFDMHLTNDLGLQDGKGNWVAIRKDVMASGVNSVMSQAAVCVAPAINVSTQHSENQIKLPDGLGIDCSPTKVCSERQCPFEKHADDTRDCNQCAAYAPKICVGGSIFGPGGCTGGHCIQRWNEPTCEAAKVAQNGVYLAEANLRKADCDRLAAQERLVCEAEKSGTKALCEVKKEAMNALARTGKFANLDVDVSVQAKKMNICLKDVNLSPSLDRLQLTLDVEGSADASVDMHFVPLDIVGHLTCVMAWSKAQTFEAQLRDSKIGISADVRLESQAEDFYANATVNQIPVSAKLSPSPTEFLLKSPELFLKCPVLSAVAPTVLALTPFVPVLKGEIDYALPAQKLSMKLAIPEQKIADKVLTVKLGSTPSALLMQGAYMAQ